MKKMVSKRTVDVLKTVVRGLTISGDPSTTWDNTLSSYFYRSYEIYLLTGKKLPFTGENCTHPGIDIAANGDDNIIISPRNMI